MTFRSRLLIAFMLATIIPLALLAFGVRRQLTSRLVAQHERRVQGLARVAAQDVERESAAIAARLSSLTRTYPCADIEAVCARLLEAQCFSYAALKRALERHAANAPVVLPALTQSGPQIRALTEYQSFWETHSHTHPQEDTDGNVYH